MIKQCIKDCEEDDDPKETHEPMPLQKSEPLPFKLKVMEAYGN